MRKSTYLKQHYGDESYMGFLRRETQNERTLREWDENESIDGTFRIIPEDDHFCIERATIGWFKCYPYSSHISWVKYGAERPFPPGSPVDFIFLRPAIEIMIHRSDRLLKDMNSADWGEKTEFSSVEEAREILQQYSKQMEEAKKYSAERELKRSEAEKSAIYVGKLGY